MHKVFKNKVQGYCTPLKWLKSIYIGQLLLKWKPWHVQDGTVLDKIRDMLDIWLYQERDIVKNLYSVNLEVKKR